MALPPVTEVIANAYRFVWENRRDCAALAYPNVLVLSVVYTIDMMTGPGRVDDAVGPGDALLLVVALSVGLTCAVLYAVALHRVYLLPGTQPTVRESLRWRGRHTRFVVRLIGLAFGLVLASTVLVSIVSAFAAPTREGMTLLAVVTTLALSFVFARLSLVLPAASVEQPLSFGESWRLSQGCGWRLLLIWLLPALPAQLLQFLVLVLATGLFGDTIGDSVLRSFVTALLMVSAQFIGVAATFVALSVAYENLVGTPPQPSAAAGT